jgi:hypothetical protein
MVCWLRNSNITNYIKNHSAAYDEVVTAVQGIPCPKSSPTPTSTSDHTNLPGEQASAPLPSQHITQEEKLDHNGQIDQHKNLFVEPYEHSSPAVRQGVNQRSGPLYDAYVEDADNSETEQTTSSSQCAANLDTWPPSNHNNNTYDPDAH